MLSESNKNDNATLCVKYLWGAGSFQDSRTLNEVSALITDKWGHNFSASDISKALHEASFLIRTGRRRSFQYRQRVSPKSKKIESVEEQLFSDDLVTKLGNRFKTELDNLHLNFGHSGTCTAFLLRKILEKSIFFAFAKNGLSKKLEDGNGTGKLIGLEAMVGAAAREKIDGVSILVPKTAEKIEGIKFLGDVSAHNPLTNVDMEAILPQMPYIITAYKELAENL